MAKHKRSGLSFLIFSSVFGGISTKSKLKTSAMAFSRILPMIALAGLLLGVVLQGQPNTAPNMQQNRSRALPISDYNAPPHPDPEKQRRRQLRNKKYDRSVWSINPTDVADNTVRVDYLDPSLPVLPVKQSDVVVVGEILEGHAYLSNDKTGVYSEFIVRVDQVLKNNGTLMPTCLIDVEREGGRVRFASGKIHSYTIDKANMPQAGARYVLFLTKQGEEHVYYLLTGYELRGDKIFPLDDLPQFKAQKDLNIDAFLSKLSVALSQ